MDDRFDMILMSPSMNDSGARIKYVINSLTPYGNDGAHYNDSINKRPNNAVADSIADAIHYASDHIPIFATYVFDSPIGINIIGSEVPRDFKLEQNYPNPFNPSTQIRFSITNQTSFVTLNVFDITGRKVSQLVNEQLNAGSYEVRWDGSKFSSGVYYYRLQSDAFTETRKMILVK
jgi:hypothetical protein